MGRIKIALLLILLIGAAALWFFGGREYLTLEAMQAGLGRMRGFVEGQPIAAAAAFFGAYVLVTAVSIPGAALMTLLAGAIFDFVTGVLLVSFASSIGSTLAMLASRFIFRDTVRKRFGDRLEKIDRGFAREGGFYLFSLRLVPFLPFFLINLLMGLTAIKPLVFYVASQLGMLPATIVYVNAGRELGAIDSLSGLVDVRLVLSFLALAALPWIGRAVVASIRRRRVYRDFDKPKTFERDIVVIGAGAAGLVASLIGATVRAKVTMIERAETGGDCLNRGCVPSKALLRAARAAHEANNAGRFGVEVPDVSVHFEGVMDHVRGAIAAIEPKDSPARYRELGVDVIEAEATVLSPWLVKAGDREISTRNIVIATGGRPRMPELPGIDGAPVYTSDNIWSLTRLPKQLVVIGGGPIACELGQAFARLGSSVTIVERGPRIMAREDEDVSAAITTALKADGVDFRLNCEAAQIDGEAGNHKLSLKDAEEPKSLPFDALLVAIGREPVVGAAFESLALETDDDGTLQTDDALATKYPNVFAIGDVAGPFQLTHAGAHQAWYAAVNALASPFRRFDADYRVLPHCTFTEPEAARVGLSEAEAADKGTEVEVIRFEFAELDRAITEGATAGFVKLLVPPGKDRILGASIVGERAGELIATIAVAMQNKIGLDKLMSTVFAYPTFAEALRFAAAERRKRHAPQRLLDFAERYFRWRRGD